MARKKRDSPNHELRRTLLDALSEPENQRRIAEALIRAATGDGAKGIGDIIKGYEKIMEIVGPDGTADAGNLSESELARIPSEQLRAMLESLKE